MLFTRRSAATVAAIVALLTSMSMAPAPALQSPPTTVSGATDIHQLSGVLHGSGSTFADRYYKAVIITLGKSAKSVKVDYRPIGSGRGKAEFGKYVTDFAGTDSLVKATDGPNKNCLCRQIVLKFIAPTYVSDYLYCVSAKRFDRLTAKV